ncbi:hypothetical protein CHS0354_033825 [Potamilus streckersoni]|uniref:Uncharacterized protein n=1 Tax=Potamilus streckersoni TaxID=2493646 RepID=A0AAE0T7Z0_9BIVA|nr:hypothetical protein CHS0354_033825 [Potamilus streckersoni]
MPFTFCGLVGNSEKEDYSGFPFSSITGMAIWRLSMSYIAPSGFGFFMNMPPESVSNRDWKDWVKETEHTESYVFNNVIEIGTMGENGFKSHCKGHATADDLVGHFKETSNQLNVHNMMQINMDGPNVNLKVLDIFQSQINTL